MNFAPSQLLSCHVHQLKHQTTSQKPCKAIKQAQCAQNRVALNEYKIYHFLWGEFAASSDELVVVNDNL